MGSELTAFLHAAAAKWARLHWPLLLAVAAIMTLGVCFIYGVGVESAGLLPGYEHKWAKQLIWAGLGGALMLLLAATDYQVLGHWSWAMYGGILALLVAVLVPGIGSQLNGARSWLVLGPLSLQPAEPAKLGTLLALAWLAAQPQTRFDTWGQLVPFVLIAGLPLTLIALQPGLGSAAVLAPLTLAVLLVSGLPWRFLGYLALLALVAAPVIFAVGLRPYQRQRVVTYLLPLLHAAPAATRAVESTSPPGTAAPAPVLPHWLAALVPDGGGAVHDDWNARQSQLAVGSGGWDGKGFLKGTQNTLGFLPRTVAPTDFIFSVIAEETGFLGCAALILLYGVVLVCALHIAAKARDAFGRNLAVGVATLIAVHVFVNIGMTIGLVPIIGIPLPFVSYGGSFMLLMLSGVGLLHSIHLHRV